MGNFHTEQHNNTQIKKHPTLNLERQCIWQNRRTHGSQSKLNNQHPILQKTYHQGPQHTNRQQ